MNYQQFLEMKQSCERKIKWLSVSVYMITLFALMQAVLLLFRIDVRFDSINMFILDQLFSKGYTEVRDGNIVLAVCFYGAFALVILSFVVSSLYCLGSKKWPYILVLFLYGIDALLCLVTSSFIQFLIHAVLLAIVCVALRYQSYLNMLKNNIWGYK